MKREQFDQMLKAARDIARHSETSTELDPTTVEWARFIIAANAIKLRPAPMQDAILKLYEADPLVGLDTPTIRRLLKDKPNISQPSVNTALHHMSRVNGRLFCLLKHGHSLYFLSQRALDAGRPAFEQKMAMFYEQRAAKRSKSCHKPKEKAIKTPKQRLERRNTPFNPDETPRRLRATQAPAGPVVIPANIKVQVIPTAVDYRYQAEPSDGPGAFMNEWQRLRGEKL